MPLPKRPKLPSKEQSSRFSSKTKDSRFENFQTDAKFRLPSKKHNKTKLDQRFSRLLTDPDFYNKASVDRYGRKIDKDAGKKKLERFYRQDDEFEVEEDEADEREKEEGPKKTAKRDRAVEKELAKVDIRGENYDPIRDGGLSSSSDDSSSEDENEVGLEEVEEQTELAGHNNEVPMGDITSRLAAVNMDWDNIRATDIMAVATSFIPAGGRIRGVVIYPSDFGMERLQREELEGPPREIFASSSTSKNDFTNLDDVSGSDASDDEERIKKELLEGDNEEFDSKALRTYQLDRLRYYYAVITCSSPEVARSLYDNMDGREYLSSANFFDMRFVPDDITFDEDPHDECEQLPDGYKPNEFVTEALSHSKVKLTWDADDNTRQEVQKRAFSRKEVDENELRAYIGSDSEEEEANAQPDKAAALRAALGLGSSEKPSKSTSTSSKRDRDHKKPEGEMVVTFSAGLSTNAQKGSVFENDPIVEETTVEKYVRKEKERKTRRKERAKAVKDGRDPDAEEAPIVQQADEDDDPWNDPFFADDPAIAKASKAQSKNSQKATKREEREILEKESAAERANLELLMVDDEGSKVQHFDMNEIIKADKAKKKGKKKGRDAEKGAAVVEDNFKMETQDPRFAKLYESHEFAIDPTNSSYKETAGMKALLEEGRKKRKRDRDDEEPERSRPKKESREADERDDLKKLAARVKAKSRKLP